jgi:hypothetical protein
LNLTGFYFSFLPPLFSGPSYTGLIAYYTFDSTAPLLDTAFSLGDLQAIGNPTYSPSGPLHGSQCAVLSSVSDSSGGGQFFRMNTLNLGAMSASGGFSICTWFMFDAATSWARIFDFVLLASGSSRDGVFLARRGTSTQLVVALYCGTASETVVIPNPIINGEWRHVCVINQGRIFSFYNNGALSLSQTASCSLNNVQLNLNFIGRSNYNNDRLLIGKVDEFQIYRRALLPSEVANIYGGSAGAWSLIALLTSRLRQTESKLG